MAHEGYDKTFARIFPKYFWPGMRKDIKLFVETCPVCDKFKKAKTPRHPLGQIPVGEKLDLLVMDIMGGKDSLPVSPSGNKCILVMVDAFTKYARAKALKDQSAATVVKAVIKSWILVVGP